MFKDFNHGRLPKRKDTKGFKIKGQKSKRAKPRKEGNQFLGRSAKWEKRHSREKLTKTRKISRWSDKGKARKMISKGWVGGI